MRWRVMARTEYAEPLEQQAVVESDEAPDLAAATTAADAAHDAPQEWLEVAVVPDDAVLWVIRDGELQSDEIHRLAGRAPARSAP